MTTASPQSSEQSLPDFARFAIGAFVGGPVGFAVGGAIGAVTGGLAGHGVGEKVNPTVEDAYWRGNYSTRPYATAGREYSVYQPAYRYGWESREQHAGRKWNDVEKELDAGRSRRQGTAGLGWNDARPAVRDAWDRVGERGRWTGSEIPRYAARSAAPALEWQKSSAVAAGNVALPGFMHHGVHSCALPEA